MRLENEYKKSPGKWRDLDIRMNNTGINIIGEPKLKGRVKRNSAHIALFLRCAYFCLCFSGILFTLNTSFSLDIPVGYAAGGITILAMILTGTLFYKKAYRIVGITVTAAILAASLYWHDIVSSSFWALVNQIQRIMNSYYGISLEAKNVAVEGTGAFWILVILFCMLTILLTGLVVQKGHTGILLQLAVIFLGLQLLCGCSFEFFPLFLVAGSLFGLAVMEKQKRARSLRILYKSGLQTGICILLLAVLIGEWLAPALFVKIEPWNREMNNYLQEIADNAAIKIGYHNNKLSKYASATGDILGNFPPDYDDKVDLRILASEKPGQNVYFKGFVGDTYERTYWSTITGYTFQENFTQEERTDIQNQFYNYIEERAAQEPLGITLERLDPIDDYGYIPYAFYTPADDGSIADGVYKNTDTPVTYSGYVNWRRWAEDGPSDRVVNAAEEKYQQYVAEQYLKVPAEGLDMLKEYCAQYDFQSVQEVIDFVIPDIQNGREYSFDLEEVPEDADFAEYFFFEQKKGYCVHFATTATLMLRLMGVPARYVTGYVALRDDFTEEDGGYTAELTDRKAHAWVEVYRRGKGWEPIEVTPGFASGELLTESTGESAEMEEPLQNEENMQPVQPTAEQELTPEPDMEEMQDPEDFQGQNDEMQNDEPQDDELQDEEIPEDAVQNDSTSGNAIWYAVRNILLTVLCLAVILVSFIAAVKTRQSRILRKRYGKFEQENRNQAAQEISYELTDMLRTAGIFAQAARDLDYARELENVFPAFARNEYVRFVEIVQKAAYGKAQISEQERTRCLKLYEKAADYLAAQMKGRKKFWWRYVKGYVR